jgi:uncharacterized protein (DUF1697 family)
MAGAVKRYVAFLRGVSPMNCKMAELKQSFERAGFEDVKTVLSSGNVVFGARGSEKLLAQKAEKAMLAHQGKSFFTQVRSVESLQQLLASDPYAAFQLKPGSKRVVTFLSEPLARKPALPVELDGARILAQRGDTVFTAYVKSPKGPVFMVLLERTFGKNITTRTWDTLGKCTKA